MDTKCRSHGDQIHKLAGIHHPLKLGRVGLMCREGVLLTHADRVDEGKGAAFQHAVLPTLGQSILCRDQHQRGKPTQERGWGGKLVILLKGRDGVKGPLCPREEEGGANVQRATTSTDIPLFTDRQHHCVSAPVVAYLLVVLGLGGVRHMLRTDVGRG